MVSSGIVGGIFAKPPDDADVVDVGVLASVRRGVLCVDAEMSMWGASTAYIACEILPPPVLSPLCARGLFNME